MGIVVTLAMLAGLCLLLPTPISIFRKSSFESSKAHYVVGLFLLLAGLWNAFWYGIQNVDRFWGQAALASGMFMIASAAVVLISLRRQGGVVARRWVHWLLIAGLLVSFLLYVVTLVQLNLGMDIVR